MSDESGAVVRRGIMLPRSSARKCREDYCKLLVSVDPDAQSGFGFEGRIFRPGSIVSEADLWPEGSPPGAPVLLEGAMIAGDGPASKRRMDQLYVLWRYNAEMNAWTELGRARSVSWEWAIELRPLAVRAMQEQRGHGAVSSAADHPAIAARIRNVFEGELQELADADKWRVLAIIHDELAGRVAHYSEFCGKSLADLPRVTV